MALSNSDLPSHAGAGITFFSIGFFINPPFVTKFDLSELFRFIMSPSGSGGGGGGAASKATFLRIYCENNVKMDQVLDFT